MNQSIYTLLLLLLIPQISLAQDCTHFLSLLQEGDVYFQKKDYEKALYKYQAAMTDCPDKMDSIQRKIKTMFDEIQELKNQAVNALENAERNRKIAEQARQAAETAQLMARENELKALALLEELASRELDNARISVLALKDSTAFLHLHVAYKSSDPKVKNLVKSYLVALIYIGLYQYQPKDFSKIKALSYFSLQNGVVLPDFNKSKVSPFEASLQKAKAMTARPEAIRFMLSELERLLGKEAMKLAIDLFTHTRSSYPGYQKGE